MLVNFRFKNCRSFYSETELSMEATSDTELREINTFSVGENLMKGGDNELLKAAVIFGSNASGKSNVIKALSYMRNVILYSASQMPIVQGNDSFAFYENADKEETLYEVEFIQNSAFYRYGFKLCEGAVIGEWLYRRVERLTPIFTRDKKGLYITGSDKVAARLINLANSSLFLSVGSNFHLEIAAALADVMSWFQNLLIVFENTANSLDIYTFENGKYKEQALRILQLADIGIKDMEVRKDKIVNIADLNDVLRFNTQMQTQPEALRGQLKQEETNLFNIDMLTAFDVFNAEKERVGSEDIMLFKDSGFNSEGTVRLLCYLGWLLVALDKGKVIFIDEIDSRLHFLVADYLIRLFNSIDKNRNNAQLICTAHNVMLMDEDLRRDQIYFTSKDKYGESKLVSLSDFNSVRKNDLFSKKYLAGFYAGLPNMQDD